MFKKATKSQGKLRLALCGVSGAGKTYSALAIAQGLGGRIAVIDTEHGSASKYADSFEFDVCELESFKPRAYVEAIKAAEAAGYDVVILDSLSHAWAGKDGALAMVDNVAARKKGNSFSAWREVTPEHNALVEAIIGCKCHVIATMRSKTAYVVETDSKGKQVPRKVGMAPVQRDGMEYEFDVVCDLEREGNKLIVDKTRCVAIADEVIPRAGKEFGERLLAWLSDGVARTPKKITASPEKPAKKTDLEAMSKAELWAEIQKMRTVLGRREFAVSVGCSPDESHDWKPADMAEATRAVAALRKRDGEIDVPV